jgi:hypothetical protein
VSIDWSNVAAALFHLGDWDGISFSFQPYQLFFLIDRQWRGWNHLFINHNNRETTAWPPVWISREFLKGCSFCPSFTTTMGTQQIMGILRVWTHQTHQMFWIIFLFFFKLAYMFMCLITCVFKQQQQHTDTTPPRSLSARGRGSKAKYQRDRVTFDYIVYSSPPISQNKKIKKLEWGNFSLFSFIHPLRLEINIPSSYRFEWNRHKRCPAPCRWRQGVYPEFCIFIFFPKIK